MSELTAEQYDQLPEFAQSDYTQVDGVYKHSGVLKMKETLNGMDEKLKGFESKSNELQTQLTSFQEQEEKKIEEAKQKALEEARTNGDVKAVEERYQQQMKDLEERTAERVRGEVTVEFQQKANAERAQSIASKIGLSIGIDSDAGEAITDLIQSRVKYENGQEIFYDAKGSALSVDRQGFIAELSKEPRFKRLVKAKLATEGAGNVDGKGGRNGSADASGKSRADILYA